MSLFLGIDTSNYTTSVALYDSDNERDISCKRLLPVKDGELGIRQSDAVFHHTQQLPTLYNELVKNISDLKNKITAIGVSEKPRPVEGSYMPCFTVGKGFAEVLGTTLGVPVYGLTHQQGHIVSALYSADKLCLLGERFIVFHVSGGTTEALLVDEKMNISLVAKTLDLNAGQAVDRVGFMLGCKFPCGKELENIANGFNGKVRVKPTLKGSDCCLSGLQNICKKMYDDNKSREEIAFYCLKYIEETIYKMVNFLKEKYGDIPFVFAGGVMSNKIIRDSLTKRISCTFAEPEYSTDNAVGIAYLAKVEWENDTGTK